MTSPAWAEALSKRAAAAVAIRSRQGSVRVSDPGPDRTIAAEDPNGESVDDVTDRLGQAAR